MSRALVLLATLGCAERPSVEVFFPNQAALDGTRVVRVELRDPTGEDCADFAQRVADDEGPRGSASKSTDVPAPFEEQDLEDAPRGRQIVVAYAFAGDPRSTPPFLAGCTEMYDSSGDDGDSEDVPVLLQHIPYSSLRISIASGNRQAGRPGGGTLPLPLTVLADAIVDGRSFVVPGLPIVFRTDRPFALSNGGLMLETFSDAAGIAQTTVELPTIPDFGSVRATSPMLENLEVTFSVSAMSDIPIQSRTIALDFDATPVALAAGVVDGAGVDLIAVGQSSGATRLMVADRPKLNPVLYPVPQNLGAGPVGVAVIDSRVAIANARIASRENAEVQLLRFEAGAIELADTLVLTASNAVGVATFERTDVGEALAVATTGRTVHDQPCTANMCCAPGAPCPGGCPADEYCVADGTCVAHDGVVVLLSVDLTGELDEEGRCERPVSACDNRGCCEEGRASCTQDACRCDVRERVRLGGWQGPLDPLVIVPAALSRTAPSQLLVGAIDGLHRLDQTPGGFSDAETFLILTDIAGIATGGFDGALPDQDDDIVWIDNAPCGRGMAIETECPRVAEIPDEAGCIGFYLTDEHGEAPMLSPPSKGSCRRHPLAFVPGQVCIAQIDDGLSPDVVVSSPSDDRIMVFAGDGRGGILDPPQAIDVPGGPMLCADLDGDDLDEIVIADGQQPGRFQILSF